MERYDRRFFERQRDGARRSARRLVPVLLELIHPKSVVDIGCGVGYMAVCVSGVRDRGCPRD